MGLDSCKLIKGRIPDSSQTRPLWHTLTAHSLKFLLSATTEGVPTWRQGGFGREGTPHPPAPRLPFSEPKHNFCDNFAEIAGGRGGGKARKEKGGDEAEPSSTSRRCSGLRSCGRSPRSPLHPINGNSPHFLLWRLGLVGCLGSASVRTCAWEGCAGRRPEGAPGRPGRARGRRPSVP